MWRDAHVLMNIEQKCTYLRVLLTGFVHDCRLWATQIVAPLSWSNTSNKIAATCNKI
jgi:hypothetical protein